MILRNFRSDFSILKTFTRKEEDGVVPVPVPDHIKLTYFVDGCPAGFTAERNGSVCTNCSVSEDGNTLLVHLKLSESNIGTGLLKEHTVEYFPDDTFPGGSRQIHSIKATDIKLWNGTGEEGSQSVDVALLSSFMEGLSAYGIACRHGFTGTEQEWLDSLNRVILKTTWAELVTMRDGGNLIPGQEYRLTDYRCTTLQDGTRTAGHSFDIILMADSPGSLNENARAVLHDGDEYFAGCNLAAWKLMYCLDNDRERFGWADTEKGRGVIYRMIDEHGNDCPYDFKNILFRRYKITDCPLSSTLVGRYVHKGSQYVTVDETDPVFAYTFCWLDESGSARDYSIVGNTMPNKEGQYTGVYGNVIAPLSSYLSTYPENPTRLSFSLNNVCFVSDYQTTTGPSYGCYSNLIAANCHSMTFANNCHGNRVQENNYNAVFGNGFKFNTVGKDSHDNIFGNAFTSNSIGSGCSGNVFGYSYSYNKIGDNCYNNILGYGYFSNIIENTCHGLVLGNNFSSNTFGTNCYNITTKDSDGTLYNYFKYNLFEAGCCSLTIKSQASGTSNVSYYHFCAGVSGHIECTRGRSFETKVAVNSDGKVKQYCEADLIL